MDADYNVSCKKFAGKFDVYMTTWNVRHSTQLASEQPSWKKWEKSKYSCAELVFVE